MSSPFDGSFDVVLEIENSLRRQAQFRREEKRRRIEEERRSRERELKKRQEQERRRKEEELKRREEQESREKALKAVEETRKKREAEEKARKIREENQKIEETRRLREEKKHQEELIILQKAEETRKLREIRQQQIHEEKFEKYLSLYDTYKASAEVAGVECREIPFNDKAEEILTKLIKKLEEQIYENSKRKYIHQAMNEEMASMGYKVIGSREMTAGEISFTEELYQIDDDGVAASVLYQDNGQISIEIGALKSSEAHEEYKLYDKMPVFLENHQRSFCSKATKFEKNMAKKGVVCEITRQPPNGTYAPSFNIENYNMKQDVKILRKKSDFIEEMKTYGSMG